MKDSKFKPWWFVYRVYILNHMHADSHYLRQSILHAYFMLKHNQPYSVPYNSWPEWFFCFQNIYCKCSDTFQMLPFIFAVLFPLLLYLIVSYSPVKFELIKLKMLACKRELTTDFRIWPYFSCLGSPYFHLDYWLILMEDGLLFFLSL